MEPEEGLNFDHSEDNVVSDVNEIEAYKNEDDEVTMFVNNEQTQSMGKSFSWSDICRVCANSNDHIIPIFEAEGAQHDLSDKIHKYLPIRVTRTDTLPIQLCYHCAATILAWHDLLEGCVEAEKQLLQMQSNQSYKEQNESKSSENLSEGVIDDPESVSIDKQDLSCVGQQEEETEQGIIGEESNLRSDKAVETFTVFLDKQHICRHSARVKSEISTEVFDKRENTKWQEDRIKEETLMPDVDPSEPENVNNEDEDLGAKVSRNRRCKTNIRRDMEKNEEFSQKAESHGESCIEPNFVGIQCTICSEKLRDCNELMKHIREHKSSLSSKKLYNCNECSKAFRVKDSLIRHQRIHRDERPFTCHVCGKQFRDSGGLSRHIKDVHAKLKNFTCDICFNSFSSKATRDDHRRTHTGERPYNCENCDKSFKSRASLYIHSKLHTDEYPYPCAHCEKKFRRRQEMLVHVSTHTGEKNYSCDVCSRRFRVKTEVARHKLTHSDEKPYVCAKCGLSFRQNRYLNNHVKSRHPQSSND